MKKIILLLLLIVGSFQGFSQTPGISYQAVILNPNVKELPGANAQSSILANSKVAIRFTIFNNANNQEYQEYHQTKTDAYGMINLLIGHGTKISSSYFNDIIWNGLSKKLKVEIDFNGSGNSYTFLSEQDLTFMPQPALSENAEAILNNTNDIIAERNRAIGVESSMSESFSTEIDALTEVDAAIQADIDIIKANMGTDGSIINTTIAAIQADVDANEIATNTALDLKADIASPSFTGIPLAPTAAAGTSTNQIATTQFVTSFGANYLPLTGGTLTGGLSGTTGIFSSGLEATSLGLKNGTGNWEFSLNSSSLILHQGGCCNRLTIDDDGNFGIGANYTPSYKLDVEGDGRFTNSVIGNSFVKAGGTASQFLKADGSVDATVYASLDSPTFTGTVSGITKAMVGLDNVDNTSDTDKPVSTATQTALDLKANLDSPTFTGTPTLPIGTIAITQPAGNNTTAVATTAFVTSAISGNYVDLTTNQTIGGTKTFSSDAEINGVTVGRGNFNENSNTAMGLGALGSNAGYANTGIGRGALAVNINGGGNTALGYIALSNNTSGTDNVAIGTQALETNSTGSQNTVIGKRADVASDGISNSVAIGANAIVTASNTIQLGSDGSGSYTPIANVRTSGNITAASYIKAGGTSSQFLMADGSVSSGPSGVVSGSGTSNYLPKFTAASTLGNSSVYDNGTNVGIGTNNPSSMFQIGGEGSTDLNLKFDAVANTSSALKFGYRTYQWRLKTNTNSGTLDPLVFSYFNGTTDVTRLTITNSGINIPDNLIVTGNTIGSNATFSGNLLVNTNQLSVNTTTNRVGIFTDSPTSMFQIGGDGGFDNPLKYDYGGEEGRLKFGYRSNEFRIKSQTNSGVLLDLIFSYYNNALATDVESMRITNTGLVTINNLRISGGNPGVGKVLTSDANGITSWVAPQASNPVREVADEYSATTSQTSFTLTQTPSASSKVKMYINGIRISNTAYSTSGTTFTYVPANNGGYALTAGDRIQMDYYY